MQKITKAIFPVAGLGTRMLPATKATPKEMLTVVDKPLIQYAVEEAIKSGIKTLIFVTGRNKKTIEDHFDASPELEAELEKKDKNEVLESIKNIIPKDVSCIYIRQSLALGLGHAVLCARQAIGNEPFAVVLPDDLMIGNSPITHQLIKVYEETLGCVLAIQEVPNEQTNLYGIIDGLEMKKNRIQVNCIVEKPEITLAPSNLAVAGRYILTPRIFDYLEKQVKGKGGEIQLTDAIEKLIEYKNVYALRYEGKRYDCGSKLGLLMANVDIAEKDNQIGAAFESWLLQRKGS